MDYRNTKIIQHVPKSAKVEVGHNTGGEPPSQKSVKSGHPGSGHTGGVAISEGVVNFDLMNSVSQHMYCLYKCWKCLWTHFWGVFFCGGVGGGGVEQ